MATDIKISSLDKIRALYTKGCTDSRCPNCNNKLTIENTRYSVTKICENCLEHAKIDFLDPCCDSPNFQKVKLIISGGSIQVREQCFTCGNVKGKAIGGLSKEERDSLPLLNEYSRNNFHEDRIRERTDFYEKLVRLRYGLNRKKKEDWFDQYTAYLNSPEWKAKRTLVLKRDNHLCQCCLDAFATQVHHKSYEFVDLRGSEPSFDLVSICTPCHNRIEAMKKQNKI